MDEKRSSGRSKRQAKVLDDGFWDCSVCTFKNSAEAYKCEMCDVRKGTSTRKPRINPQLVALQKSQTFAPPPKKERGHPFRKDRNGDESTDSSKLKNVDRSRPSHMSVTVGNVTVVVTDYQPKLDPRSSDSHISSDASDTNSVIAPDDIDESSRDTTTA